MRKIVCLLSVIAIATLLINCTASKKASASKSVTTYEGQIRPILETSCTPCHFPDKGGRKKAYTNIDSVRHDIDEIIRRISLNTGERGFMPFKKPKLSDSTIAIFVKWKAEGLQ